MVKEKEKEYFIIIMEIYMMVIGKMMLEKEKEYLLVILLIVDMKEILKMIK